VSHLTLRRLPLLGGHHTANGEGQRHRSDTAECPSVHANFLPSKWFTGASDRICHLDASDGFVGLSNRAKDSEAERFFDDCTFHDHTPFCFCCSRHRKQKKADVAEHQEVFRHVGLLVNELPSVAGLLFI